MTKVNLTTPESKQVEDNPVKVGDWFYNKVRKDYWVLVISDTSKIILSSITEGHRWQSPITVGDYNKLSQSEAKEIFGAYEHEFTRVKSVDITNVILEK